MRRRDLLRGLALAILLPLTAQPASFPPDLRFRTLRSARVSVHYHQGLERLAREAAGLAEEVLARHLARYPTPLPRVHIVLSDIEDDPNGFASPLPYPLVHLRAVAPDGSDDLGNHEGWLRLVLTHELLHVVHLEQAGGVVRLGRSVFGRAPILFPNASTPTWTIEGLATYEETEATAFGRGRDPDSRMVLRMAAMEEQFPREDRAVGGLDRWPGGRVPYLFGEAFLRDLRQRFGDEALPRMAKTHARKPVPYLDELTMRSVTGATVHTRWKEWRAAAVRGFSREAERIRARGLSRSQPLTTRGVVQLGPRVSPDGRWIAYTSRTLKRDREVRVMRADGTGDRRLARRNGGTGLSWTPDGRTLVYDEPEVWRLFATRGGLRTLDVASGRARWIARGLRARDPDVAPDGARVVFVRRGADRSELAAIALDGSGVKDLTRSDLDTQWSGPRWSPDGRAIVASRWRPGGWLDLVMVDGTTGVVTPLTTDRAKDVEPTWTSDGTHVVFRSDRDGVSNLYALRLGDGALLRVSNVLGGAFAPHVASDGRWLAFSSYSARGYDIHRLDVDLARAAPADSFTDPYPEPRPAALAVATTEGAYDSLPALAPRFWMPYLVLGDETRLGAVTGGLDPLFRHAWGLDLQWGSQTRKLGAQAFYQYDRWRPTLLAVAQDTHEPEAGGVLRTRELVLRASLPVARSLRKAQAVSLSWRRERETLGDDRIDFGGLEAGWALSTVRRHPYSISPLGTRLRVAYLQEDPAFGSQVSLGKLLVDVRGYRPLFAATDALAVRLAVGTTFGRPGFRCSFAVGGFPEGALVDVVRTNHGVLRGYREPGCDDTDFTGRRFASLSAEYRFPLAHPQRGFRSLPVFVRHLHGAVFADAGDAWTVGRDEARLKTSVGAALGADLVVGHALPLTGTVGVARGLSPGGETSVYFRAGLAF